MEEKKTGRIWDKDAARRYISDSLKGRDAEEKARDIMGMDLSSRGVREALQASSVPKPGGWTLILGPGGSGKSLIYKAIAHTARHVLPLASTGIAAFNLTSNGWMDDTPRPVTIHSGLRLPARNYYSPIDARKVSKRLEELGTKTILVDEISMVSPNLLDVILYSSVLAGCSVMLFGDPMQLPPVDADDNMGQERLLMSRYQDWRFFRSFFWMFNTDKSRVIILDSIYRQSDPGFKAMLNRARLEEMTEEDWGALEKRVSSNIPEGALVLCATNAEAEAVSRRLSGTIKPRIRVDARLYRLIDKGLMRFFEIIPVEGLGYKEDGAAALMILPRKNDKDIFLPSMERKAWNALDRGARGLDMVSGYQRQLELCPGDRIMVTQNTYARLAIFGGEKKTYIPNGMMGTYIGRCNRLIDMADDAYKADALSLMGLEDIGNRLIVRLDDGKSILVERAVFSTSRLGTDGKHRYTEVAMQYPLKRAFAITYHKAQGLTLDKVHLMLGKRNLQPGLGYLGLSRCRTLEGLTLSSVEKGAFTCDKTSLGFMAAVSYPRLKTGACNSSG